MANQQLLDYIKQQAQRGKTREEIKQELLKVGWQIGDIEEALNVVGSTRLSDSSISPSSVQEGALTPPTLPGVGDLLKRTFSVYKARLGTFVGIMIIPLIAGLLVFGISLFASILFIFISGLAVSLLSIILRLAVMFLNFWVQISLIFAIRDRKEKIGIIESFRRSWHKIISFAWVSFLASFIITGGSMLFIIPGIIFGIWFTFSTYVLISEDLKGMNALFRSKQLVAGYWWKVLWRFFVLGVIVFAIFIPVILVYVPLVAGGLAISTGPAVLARFAILLIIPLLVSLFITLVITPFMAVFNFLLYEDLKRQKAQVVFEPPKKGTKIKFILIGVVGFLLIPAIFASIVLVSLSGARERAQEARITAMMSQLPVVMEFYSRDNNYSYSGANCSLTELAPVCSSIKEHAGEIPTIKSSAEDYCFYLRLPSGEYYCSTDTFSSRKTTIFPGGPGYCDGITFNCP